MCIDAALTAGLDALAEVNVHFGMQPQLATLARALDPRRDVQHVMEQLAKLRAQACVDALVAHPSQHFSLRHAPQRRQRRQT